MKFQKMHAHSLVLDFLCASGFGTQQGKKSLYLREIGNRNSNVTEFHHPNVMYIWIGGENKERTTTTLLLYPNSPPQRTQK